MNNIIKTTTRTKKSPAAATTTSVSAPPKLATAAKGIAVAAVPVAAPQPVAATSSAKRAAALRSPTPKRAVASKPAVTVKIVPDHDERPMVAHLAPAPSARTPESGTNEARTTTITGQTDIGFGNVLYIRGEGPGLSWDKGVPMNCVADDQWKIVLGESARPIVFKFLINDLSWSAGGDYSVKPGDCAVLKPIF